jgi:hypothetical protein
LNIFITDIDPQKSASYLDTIRLNKQILELAQIISTVLIKHNAKGDYLYKSTHENHPITKWAGENIENLLFCIKFLIECAKEFYKRRGKLHKSLEVLNDCPFFVLLVLSGDYKEYTSDIKFYNCTDYDNLPVFEAYKKTLNKKWESDKEKGRIPKFN